MLNCSFGIGPGLADDIKSGCFGVCSGVDYDCHKYNLPENRIIVNSILVLPHPPIVYLGYTQKIFA